MSFGLNQINGYLRRDLIPLGALIEPRIWIYAGKEATVPATEIALWPDWVCLDRPSTWNKHVVLIFLKSLMKIIQRTFPFLQLLFNSINCLKWAGIFTFAADNSIIEVTKMWSPCGALPKSFARCLEKEIAFYKSDSISNFALS